MIVPEKEKPDCGILVVMFAVGAVAGAIAAIFATDAGKSILRYCIFGGG